MIEKVLKKNAIKAYKAFDADWTCRGFRYKVGKTYKTDGEISICENGFHACERASDCFNYYPFEPKNIKFAKVLCWGKVEKMEGDSKLCCSNIQIVRAMRWEEVLRVCNSGNWNSGYCNSGYCNSGYCNSGNWNAGNRNTGNCNTGNYNTGNRNIGNRNTGNGNSGYCNSGYCNSGDHNTGGWNTGNCNSGYYNSGSRNSGYYNSGNWNSGNWNSGFFNTPEQKSIFCFNKPTEKRDIDFPNFLYFDLAEWVPVSSMTAEEKNEHPECDVICGYLKVYDYKEAFRKSFSESKAREDWKEELRKLKAIPNFDAEIFYEISGIKPEELN